MKVRKELVVAALVLFVAAVYGLNQRFPGLLRAPAELKKSASFHTPREREALEEQINDPIAPGEYFLHSVNCQGCHGSDTANYANVDYNGVDVNVYDDWRSTMMALSSKDPLWRAKVSHEILVNPGHSLELQNTCTKCHAPMGRFTSEYHGNLDYTLTDMYTDSLGLDGVSCTSCHTIGTDGLGTRFTGDIPYDTTYHIYGPFQNPITGPMQLYTGFTPTYSPHVSEGRFCSPCHTLITHSVDLSGTPTGRSFVEQATYHEWLNSAQSQDNITCQKCHMPQVLDSVVIANGYLNMPPRSPFNRHKFMGSNEYMIRLIKENKTRLGVNVPDKNFDSTLAITNRNLRNQSVNLDLMLDSMTTDTAYFTVKLTNKVGHKFPSGYPSRRAYVKFVVIGSSQDTIFQSGLLDNNYELINNNLSYEPHYDVISSESQVQIYEMVMGDVNGNRTTLLERADTVLKDNRLVPEGFLSTSPVYDTVEVVGDALTDPDFNKTSSMTEGTGKDYVHYHVPIASYPNNFSVYSYMYYQAVPPRWVEDMFTFSSAEIDTFKTMFLNSDRSPVLMQGDSLLNLALGVDVPSLDQQVSIYPDPTSDGWVTVKLPEKADLYEVNVYSLSGARLQTYKAKAGVNSQNFRLPDAAGTYIMELLIDQRRVIRKVIRN